VPVVGRARIYVCGVTPYDVTHLGHASTYVWVDAADRVLRRLGASVEVCRNLTDVDDVLTAAAERAGQPYQQYAAVQAFHLERDLDALGVRRPTHEPRAHSFVPQVVELAEALLAVDAAYVAAGSVYLHGAPVAERAGLDRDRALALLADNGGRTDDPGQARPARPGRLAGQQRRRAGLAVALGAGPSRLARRVHRDGAVDLRPERRPARRRRRPALPAPRLRGRAGRGGHRRHPVRPHLAARGLVQVEGEKMAKSTGNLVFSADLVARSSGPVVRTLLLDRPPSSRGTSPTTPSTAPPSGWTPCTPQPVAPAGATPPSGRSSRRWPTASTSAGRSTSPSRRAAAPRATSSRSWRCDHARRPGWHAEPVTPSARDDDAGRGEDDQPAGQRRRAEDHLARVRVELAEQAAAVLPLSELPGAGRDLSRVEPLLRRVLDAVTELLGTDMAAVWVVDPAAQELYAVAWTGLEDDYIAPLRVPFGDGSAGRAVVDLAPVLVEDVDRWPSYDRYRDGAARHGIRSVFSIPMLTLAGEAVGALSAYHRAPSVSGDRELQLLETMASQAAEIVERARLHAEARALAGRERRRGEQLRMLAEAAGQLTAADDLETLLAVVTDAAVSIIGCHQGVATRLPHGWADATTYVALSETYDAWRGYDVVPQGLGVLEPVFRDNQVLRLTGEQMRAHPAWRGLRDAPGHPPLPDYLAAPFVGRDGSNLGLVQLSHKTDDSAFTAEDEAVVVQLSRMASSVLERLEALEGERAAREEAEAAAVVRGLLLDASAVFAASIEPGEVGARLLELAVPRLAEIAVLHLVDERDRPELEGVRCREPEHEAVARAWLSAPGSLDPDADYGVHAVLRAGREQLLPEVTEEMVRSIATDDASARQLRIIARRSGLVVPLLARGPDAGRPLARP
jgi:cysteinyl-tRNA synthetase